MGVGTAGTEAVEGGAEVAQVIGIAEAAALHQLGGQTELFRRREPMIGQALCASIERPSGRDALFNDFDGSNARRGGSGEGFQIAPCLLQGFRGKSSHLQLKRGLVRNAIDDRAASDAADVEGQFSVVVGDRRRLLNRRGKGHDGVHAFGMGTARMSCFAVGLHTIQCAALARCDKVIHFLNDGSALKHQHRLGSIRAAFASAGGKIIRKDFFRGIGCDQPIHPFKHRRSAFTQPL